jgi:microcystin-dependent protein
MSQPYVGEIKMFAGNFAPQGWLFCDGSLVPIAENATLFNLIGTTYGGDGQTNFSLPDLRGRIPVHQGTSSQSGASYLIGQAGGTEQETLTPGQIRVHNHALEASGDIATPAVGPTGVPAASNLVQFYGTGPTTLGVKDPPGLAMASSAIGQSGGSQPHDNLAPYLCVNFIISLLGIFPSQG